MSALKNICVYCGSGSGLNPEFSEAAERLGRRMAEAGLGLVYGGGSIGLMGTVARSVLLHGGTVTGVIPKFLIERERMLEDVQELIVTEDMHERKRLMFDKADAFVALPGGLGTLEETVEMLTWAQLGRHAKPVALANIAGYWDPLNALLAHMRAETFIRPGLEVDYLMVDEIDDVIPRIRDRLAAIPAGDLADAEVTERM